MKSNALRKKLSRFALGIAAAWAIFWLLIQASIFSSHDWAAVITATLILAGWFLFYDWLYDGKIDGVTGPDARARKRERGEE